MRSKFHLSAVGFVSFVAGGALLIPTVPAFGQTPLIKEAVAVCADQRTPFIQIRERNREQTSGRAAAGALIGILGGVAAGAQVRDGNGKSSTTAMVLGGVMGGVAGGYIGYLDAKRKIASDNRELVRMIDSDARGYATRIQAMVGSIRSTGKCRQDQIATWSQRLDATRGEYSKRQGARDAALAAVTDPKERRTVERENKRANDADLKILNQMKVERDSIEAAIRDDKKLQDDVLKYFDIDITGMAQAQAEVEGTSTASLRGPVEAYVVEVRPPAILATLGPTGGSTTSAFGSSSSAFGGGGAVAAPPPAAAAQPPATGTATATRSGSAKGNTGKARGATTPPPPKAEAWEAVVVKPAVTPQNGHQAALVAQRDAQAESSAATQSALARLRMVYEQPKPGTT